MPAAKLNALARQLRDHCGLDRPPIVAMSNLGFRQLGPNEEPETVAALLAVLSEVGGFLTCGHCSPDA